MNLRRGRQQAGILALLGVALLLTSLATHASPQRSTPTPGTAVRGSGPSDTPGVSIAARSAGTRRLVPNRRIVVNASPVSLPPVPDFISTCAPSVVSSACLIEGLAAINRARSFEGIGPMTMNLAAFASMTGPQQLLAIIDLERTARGLRPVAALTAPLNSMATLGADTSSDPIVPHLVLGPARTVISYSSNWAGGIDVLGADYLWLYDDGVGYNRDCPTSGSPGCWAHRDNVLSPNPSASSCAGTGKRPVLLMGAAVVATQLGQAGIGELLVTSCGHPRNATFSWRAAKRILFGTPPPR